MKRTIYLFYALVINFALILSSMFLPFVGNLFSGTILFLFPFVTFSALGFLLVFMVRRHKVEGKLKKNLNLTGYSAGFIFVGVVLHNLISALGNLLLEKEIEEPVFFILATIILPILFIVGAARSVLLIRKQ